MYKRIAIIILFLTIFLTPTVFSQTTRDDTVFMIEKITQQTENVVTREMTKTKDELKSNMDENYAQLDRSMDAKIQKMAVKLLIGFTGGFTIILIGYAWLVSFVNRKYTFLYQRLALRKKFGKTMQEGKMVAEDRELEKEIMDAYEGAKIKDLFKKEAPKEPEREPFQYGIGEFDYEITKEKVKKPTSKIWYIIGMILIVLLGLLVLQLFFNINILGFLKIGGK